MTEQNILMTDPTITLTANIVAVKKRISLAATSVGRKATDIRLIAVTKTFSIGHVEAAISAGLIDLGENKIQEALHKQAKAKQQAYWHFIGHLQSNKARKAIAFDWIHSLNSVELLRRLNSAAADSGRLINLLIQADISGESTKHGASKPEIYRILDYARECQFAKIKGLMTIPPWSENPEKTRPYFRALRELRDELRSNEPDVVQLDHLSMGMSHDLEVAVEEGATMVRIGTAIFGRRTTKSK